VYTISILVFAVLFFTSLILLKNRAIHDERMARLADDEHWIEVLNSTFEYKYVRLSPIVETDSLILDAKIRIERETRNPGPYVRTWAVYQYPRDNAPEGKFNHRYSGFIDYYGQIHVFGYY